MWTSSVEKIVSGGQTGVDQGALDAALELGLDHGGWCPRGRLAEDGTIPARFSLTESHSAKYAVRTRQNVLDSDATLILFNGEVSGGTALTRRLAIQHGRPLLQVNLDRPLDLTAVRSWLDNHRIKILNVAGPRESNSPGVSDRARQFLRKLMEK
jgi:hypothetical protein